MVSSFTQGQWAITLAYIAAILQIVGCYQIYCRPTFNFFYRFMINTDQPTWSTHNTMMRAIVTICYTGHHHSDCCHDPLLWVCFPHHAGHELVCSWC